MSSASTEWSQVESSMEALAPSSADLFDGDILGDELMDIYNAAVVGGGDDTDTDDMDEIPSFLDSADIKHDGTSSTPIDDGFGSFRPSSSFNDLPSLDISHVHDAAQVPSACVQDAAGVALLAPVVSSTSLAASPLFHAGPQQQAQVPADTSSGIATVSTPAKRKPPNGIESLASKKSRKASGGTAKKAGVSSKASSSKAKAPGTPNPLTIPSAAPQPVPSSTSSASNVAPVKAGAQGVTSQSAVGAGGSAPPGTSAAPTTKALAITKAAAQVSKTAVNPIVPASVTSSVPTEADFKGVAQAAVNNLIINAGTQKTSVDAKTPTPSTDDVDTSSEHVKALTGSNWVSVCGGDTNNASGSTTGEAAGTDSANDADAEQATDLQNKNRRQNLTPDERARQNRDRNREHARNTRLRKKAYVEELKRTLTAMVNQRDAAENEKRHAAQRELEQREVRFRVLEEFLKLRGRNEVNAARWSAIFEEGMTLTLPVTDFRGMVQNTAAWREGGTSIHEQVLTGVTEIMEDSALCAEFLQGLGKGVATDASPVSFVYNCDRKNFFMDNCIAMMEFTATTVGAVDRGAMAELTMKGNARATFSPASNKLITVSMTFDTGAIMSQINSLVAKANPEYDAYDVAAQEAANEADAILDSLQMPHIEPSSIRAKINVVPPSSGSSTGSVGDKGDSSDDDKEDVDDAHAMDTRRILRRQD